MLPGSRQSRSRRISSSSDENSGPSRRKKNRLTTPVAVETAGSDDDDEEEEELEEDIGIQMGSRSSERLNRKSSRSFQMPSRDSVWSSIPTTPTSADKAINRLKPRRVVNNFTRITHRYNQDVYYTDDDDCDTDEFIASDSTGSDQDDIVSCEEQRPARKTRRHRIKGYRRKILCPASSSSGSDTEVAGGEDCDSGLFKEGRVCDGHGDEQSGVNIGDRSDPDKQSAETTPSTAHSDTTCRGGTTHTDSDNREWGSKSGRGQRRRSRIASSSDSDQSTWPSAKGTQLCVNSKTQNDNSSVENKDHSSLTGETSEKPGVVDTLSTSLVPACGTDNCKPGTDNGSNSKSDNVSNSKSASGSGADSDSNSNSDSDSASLNSNSDHEALDNIKSTRARHQIQKQESAKKKKFEAFLEARRKVSASKKK